MTTTTTNLPVIITLPQDWSLALGSLTDLNYNGRSIILAVLVGILGAYTLAALLHAVGLGGLNIFLGIGVWVAIAAYGFQSFAIAVAFLGGLGYAIDPKVNLVPGVKAGLEALGRLVNFAMMITGFTFFFYGTWPLGIPFMGYPIILMGIIFVNNILFYERMASSGWAWKLGGYYAIIILIIVLFGQIPIVKAAGTWIKEAQETAAAAISREAPPPPTAEENEAAAEAAAYNAEVARRAQVAQAGADAAAAEAARLTTEVSANLPTTIRVPLCEEGEIWSTPVSIPAGWFVRSSWGGRVLRAQYLNEGVWKDANNVDITEAVEAFRYCTTSSANADIGAMTLVWTR